MEYTKERKLCMEKLEEFIKNEDIIRQIELGIYHYTLDKAKERCLKQDFSDIHFKRIYVNKIHQIYTNLDPESYVENKYFLDRILSEEIQPYQIAYLGPHEIHYEKWKDIVKKQNAADEFEGTAVLGTKTDEYQCGRCKNRNCSYITAQLRSCDEPSSLIITCLSCNKKWRIG